MKLMYFAWMREHIGTAHEERTLPDRVKTVAELIAHLREQSPGHAAALGNMDVVRVAINQEYCDLDAAVADGDEIAFFPPVTGG
ncbi:molybdopterin converting factor subunit 1 [Alphaproteobacteria bacterium LSUCC0684]